MWERAMMAYWAVNDSVMDWQMMCLFYCSSVTGLFSPAPPPLPRYDWTVAVIETGAASLSRRWVAVTHLSLSTKTNIFSPDKENNNKQNNNNNLKKKKGGEEGNWRPHWYPPRGLVQCLAPYLRQRRKNVGKECELGGHIVHWSNSDLPSYGHHCEGWHCQYTQPSRTATLPVSTELRFVGKPQIILKWERR